MIPLLAGAKVYLSPKQDWYIAGLLGANFITAETTCYWVMIQHHQPSLQVTSTLVMR